MPKRKPRSRAATLPPGIFLVVIAICAWLWNVTFPQKEASTAAVINCLIYGGLLVALIAALIVFAKWWQKQKAEQQAHELAIEHERQGLELERAQLQRKGKLDSSLALAMNELYPDLAPESLPRFLRSLDSRHLELLAESVYQHLEYDAEHTGGGGDRGVDVRLKALDGRRGMVQCKQYQKPIQPETVRAVRGAGSREVSFRYLWAPGGFSHAALEEAQRRPIVETFDEHEILELISHAFPVAMQTTTSELAPTSVPISIYVSSAEPSIRMVPTQQSEEEYLEVIPQGQAKPKRYWGMSTRQIAVLAVVAIGIAIVLCVASSQLISLIANCNDIANG